MSGELWFLMIVVFSLVCLGMAAFLKKGQR